HTPDGLENVLETAQQIATKKLYCVVGCGGDRDKTKRPIMAEIALKYAEEVVFTSDNPRTEDPLKIVEEMVVGTKADNYLIELDRKKAIQLALDLAEEGDIVLVAGKGHETYQIIGEETIHFDDSEVISDYCSELEVV
ncbi:glutamate ligase domain-containing protein, partial [Jeotgalibaca porci]